MMTNDQKSAGEQLYVICKYAAYYRQNAQGYTANIAEAGRFTLAEAISHSHPNGSDGPRDGITYEPAPRTPSHGKVSGDARDRLCKLIEANCPRIDPFTHIAIGSQVEALADAILALSTRPETVAAPLPVEGEVIQADIDVATAILSAARGYGVKIRPEHSAVQMIAAHRRAFSGGVDEVRGAATEVLKWRVGELPDKGYIRDNDHSRAAIGKLVAALHGDQEG